MLCALPLFTLPSLCTYPSTPGAWGPLEIAVGRAGWQRRLAQEMCATPPPLRAGGSGALKEVDRIVLTGILVTYSIYGLFSPVTGLRETLCRVSRLSLAASWSISRSH